MSQDHDTLSRLGLTPAQVIQLPSAIRSRLVNLLLRWEEYDVALACLDELIPHNPELVSLLDEKARALLGLGRLDEALATMRSRHDLRVSWTSRAQEARIHLARGDGDAALAIARELVAAESDSAIAWGLLGEVHLACGEYAAALVAYNRLAELRPHGHAYLLGMLALHQAQGDLVTASAYAVRLERSVQEERALPAYILRRLRDYYRVSGEPNRAQAQESALVTLYEAEIAELEAALTGKSPQRKDLRPEPSSVAGASPVQPAEPPLESACIAVSEAERSRLERAARELFGFQRLLPGQAETMATILRGQDVLTILPTGGGKSLCYQLPAFLEPKGITLVISPLIALMKDQVDSLPDAVRRKATSINSALDGDELRQRLRQIAAGGYRLVYAAPERLRQPSFLHVLRRAGINRLVIDEAHCVSIWGHDFRPDYLYIGRARQALGNPPLLAMTATAPPRVRQDIVRRIGASSPDGAARMSIVATPCGRPNLRLEARQVRNADEKLRHLLTICAQEQGSGIVYVNSRERSEQLAELLSSRGLTAGYYHAGMGDGAVRAAAQDAFMHEEVRIMVATVAFGMGIDKADIRFILHYDLPSSLESYYQEAGRAGRDGQPARCIVLYAPADRGTLTLRARRDALSIELLRQVYAAVKRRLAGATLGRVALGDLARDVQAEETPVRVALSLLEETNLLRRYQDAPRTALVQWRSPVAGASPLYDEEGLVAFADAARLRTGEMLPLDVMQVAQAAGLPPEEMEERLLAWADTGRLNYRSAGRDLLLELLPTPTDAAVQVETLLDRYATIQGQRIDEIVAYAKTSHCRHGHLSAYLTGQVVRECSSCDNCRPDASPTAPSAAIGVPDEREQLLTILRCAATAPWSWGRQSLVHILRGDAKAPEKGRESCAWGVLAFRSASAVGKLLDHLVAMGLLQPRDLAHGGTVLDLTAAGRAALGDPARFAPASAVRRPTPPRAQPPSPDEDAVPDAALFERLRAWRRDVAREAGLPPYIVAHDSVLRAIAALKPGDKAALRSIKGIRDRKIAKYGAAILEIVSQAKGSS